jgi:predicted ATP-grasp superfamily ATP-dependent carboligase
VTYDVLVTDAEERSVLAACRGLIAAGYRVSATARTPFAAAHWSRSCRERFVLPDPRQNQVDFVEGLKDILGRRRYSVLLPGTEPSLIAVSERREQLEPLVRIGLPPVRVVEQSLDKIRLMEAAAAAGLPCPATIVCSDEDDAQAAAREFGFPVVVKPARSCIHVGPALRQEPVFVVRDETALGVALPRVGKRFIVQRLEENRTLLSCSGVFADGRLQVEATARYLRTWPVAAGSASLAETIPLAPALRDKIEHLLADLGWQGLFELEFLADGEGQLAVIDFNPRMHGWLALAIGAGSNLPAAWCDWVLGRPARPMSARAGVRYRWEEGELLHLLWQLRRGRLKAAARVLRPRRHMVYAYLKLRDPLPLVARSLDLTFRGLRHRRPRATPSPAAASASRVREEARK